MTFLETKRHLNKPDQFFSCELVKRAPNWVLLKYVSDRSWQVGETFVAPGSVTFAFYRSDAGVVLWKMCGPAGRLLGHLFHICKDLAIFQDGVTYLDLLLDIWVDAAGRVQILDRDELAACETAGAVDEADLAWIRRQETDVMHRYRHMIAELNALLGSGVGKGV